MNKKLKIALAQLNPLVGDVSGNVDKLLKIRSELKNDVDLLVAPELYISGCLLYTSPSPRDNRVSRMPSSA